MCQKHKLANLILRRGMMQVCLFSLLSDKYTEQCDT